LVNEEGSIASRRGWARSRPRLRSIALPTEHGGWGFLIEPLLLGLGVALSAAGGWLGLATLGGFLARHPLKLAWGDRRRGRYYPRTLWAERFALLYSLVALAAFALALRSARSAFWVPLILGAPFALVQIYSDIQNRGRQWISEVSGAIALGTVASAIAMAGGWSLGDALVLWWIQIARAITSISYVRARLRLERQEPADVLSSWGMHLAALIVLAALSYAGRAPWLAAVAMGIQLARALKGLSPYRRPARPQAIGFGEIAFGLINATLVVVGYAFGL